MEKLCIGTTLYFVVEHIYSLPETPFRTETEFCVCSGTLVSYIRNGTTLHIKGKNPKGQPSLYYYRAKGALGNSVFLTPQEAAEKALKTTEKYEQRWACLGIKLRRPWASYLEG